MFKKTIFVMLALVLALSACAPAVPTPEVMMDKPSTATEEMMESPTEVMMDQPTDVAEMPADHMLDTPAWFDMTLTNVRTGEDFSINDFNGKVVLVEDLAMWCSNCKKQQIQIKTLLEDMGMSDDLVLIGLDIDPNEQAADLKTYIENDGFSWLYAIAPVEVAREIGNLYGDQFLNPPSSPIFIVDRKGQVHPMPFGTKSAEDLKSFIEPFLSENM